MVEYEKNDAGTGTAVEEKPYEGAGGGGLTYGPGALKDVDERVSCKPLARRFNQMAGESI